MTLRFFLLNVITLQFATVKCGYLEIELVNELFENYNKNTRPVYNVSLVLEKCHNYHHILKASQAVNVTLGLTIHELVEVNLEQNSITAVFWLNFAWTDPFLSWQSKKKYAAVGCEPPPGLGLMILFCQVRDIRLSPDDIWTPDVEVYNLREMKFLASKRNNRVVLSRDGNVIWVPPNLVTASCHLDPTWFPFDDQKCVFKIGSWTYNGLQLDIQEVRALSECFSSLRRFL